MQVVEAPTTSVPPWAISEQVIAPSTPVPPGTSVTDRPVSVVRVRVGKVGLGKVYLFKTK